MGTGCLGPEGEAPLADLRTTRQAGTTRCWGRGGSRQGEGREAWEAEMAVRVECQYRQESCEGAEGQEDPAKLAPTGRHGLLWKLQDGMERGPASQPQRPRGGLTNPMRTGMPGSRMAATKAKREPEGQRSRRARPDAHEADACHGGRKSGAMQGPTSQPTAPRRHVVAPRV